MKRLHASALAAVMILFLVAGSACGTTGNSGPWGGYTSYGASPRAYYVPYGAYPHGGYYAPYYGSYPRDYRSYRRGYRYTGDNERCSDRRESCQKWSSKRGRYIPDYGETRRQYGKDAERDQRQRHTR